MAGLKLGSWRQKHVLILKFCPDCAWTLPQLILPRLCPDCAFCPDCARTMPQLILRFCPDCAPTVPGLCVDRLPTCQNPLRNKWIVSAKSIYSAHSHTHEPKVRNHVRAHQRKSRSFISNHSRNVFLMEIMESSHVRLMYNDTFHLFILETANRHNV
jgi:hypothetical protein